MDELRKVVEKKEEGKTETEKKTTAPLAYRKRSKNGMGIIGGKGMDCLLGVESSEPQRGQELRWRGAQFILSRGVQ